MLALEPEAASIWCQLVPTEEGRCLSAPGTRYMVADLGGSIPLEYYLYNGSIQVKLYHGTYKVQLNSVVP
jgi:hypothetical protein